MSFLDNLAAPFGIGAQTNAAQAQTQGIQAGLAGLLPQYAQGQQQLQQNYGSGLQPFQQNFSQAQPGIAQLRNILGLGGAAGTSGALQALQSTPGYQFSLQQARNQGQATAQQNGYGGSGNEALALQQQAQGLALQNYNNYVGQLQPYLNEANQSASGIGTLYAGLGNQLNANSMGTGNAIYGANASLGNVGANLALAPLTAGANIVGLGSGLLGGLAGSSALAGAGKALGSGLSNLFNQSDRRTKDDIEQVGKLNDGQKVYRFRYKGDDTPHIGLMAQEVEKRHPEAVAEIDGIKFVNYGKATDRAAQLQAFMR